MAPRPSPSLPQTLDMLNLARAIKSMVAALHQ